MTAGVGAHNVTPDSVFVKLNLRFSPEISFEEIKPELSICWKKKNWITLLILISMPNHTLQQSVILPKPCKKEFYVTDKPTQLSCSGGTSDGRFMAKTGCEIVELGPKFETIHKINEKVEKKELELLTDIYHQILLNLNVRAN